MSETVDLRALGILLHQVQGEVRGMRREMAMLRAQQGDLPTTSQFQAGLTEIDKQFVELGDSIAEKITSAIGERLGRIEEQLAAIAARLKP
jgi:hypothetical protein